jgi:vacuolar protein sorting-associated protein 35
MQSLSMSLRFAIGLNPANSTITVLTKVFPDEYHLHTLDLMLSAIARLNPHVDMKKIVIGLMDRLSSYAARESEATHNDSQGEAVPEKLEKLNLEDSTTDGAGDADGDKAEGTENGEVSGETDKDAESETTAVEASAAPNGETNGSQIKIPGDIKLYEVFYEQVVNLVQTRKLSIQDTMALLVSLTNLAL